MANYNEIARTNYFHVIDEEKYQDLFKKLWTEDFNDFSCEKEDHSILHGFGYTGGFEYFPNMTDPEEEPDEDPQNIYGFLNDLRKLLPDGEAIELQTIGWENLDIWLETLFTARTRISVTIPLQTG